MPRPIIRTAINYYIRNYCYRKCFRHDSILNDCFRKFEILAEKVKDTKITIKEFNQMMKQGDIKIIVTATVLRNRNYRVKINLKNNSMKCT